MKFMHVLKILFTFLPIRVTPLINRLRVSCGISSQIKKINTIKNIKETIAAYIKYINNLFLPP